MINRTAAATLAMALTMGGALAADDPARAQLEQRIKLTARLYGDGANSQRIASSGHARAMALLDEGRALADGEHRQPADAPEQAGVTLLVGFRHEHFLAVGELLGLTDAADADFPPLDGAPFISCQGPSQVIAAVDADRRAADADRPFDVFQEIDQIGGPQLRFGSTLGAHRNRP